MDTSNSEARAAANDVMTAKSISIVFMSGWTYPNKNLFDTVYVTCFYSTTYDFDCDFHPDCAHWRARKDSPRRCWLASDCALAVLSEDKTMGAVSFEYPNTNRKVLVRSCSSVNRRSILLRRILSLFRLSGFQWLSLQRVRRHSQGKASIDLWSGGCFQISQKRRQCDPFLPALWLMAVFYRAQRRIRSCPFRHPHR
jgi:hypothetical protein